MKSVTIDIPDDLAISLAAYARQLETTEDDLIRRAIDHYLRTVVQKRPTMIGSVSNPEVRGADTEDWLLVHWEKDIMGETRESQ